jgi:hypothetical protein
MTTAELSGSTDRWIWIRADSTHGRRSRASAINAAKRAYERAHGVRLALISKSYSETHGFLSRSEFRYEITS